MLDSQRALPHRRHGLEAHPGPLPQVGTGIGRGAVVGGAGVGERDAAGGLRGALQREKCAPEEAVLALVLPVVEDGAVGAKGDGGAGVGGGGDACGYDEVKGRGRGAVR